MDEKKWEISKKGDYLHMFGDKFTLELYMNYEYRPIKNWSEIKSILAQAGLKIVDEEGKEI